MSIFDVKKSSAWNYTHAEKADYIDTLGGVVVGMDNPQAYDYRTKQPRKWDDGTPVRNIRLFIAIADGSERSVTFRPKGALYDAIVKAGDLGSLTELVGRNITISTEPGAYSVTNPRPWKVIVGDVVEGAKLHKVPVIDYDSDVSPITGE